MHACGDKQRFLRRDRFIYTEMESRKKYTTENKGKATVPWKSVPRARKHWINKSQGVWGGGNVNT